MTEINEMLQDSLARSSGSLKATLSQIRSDLVLVDEWLQFSDKLESIKSTQDNVFKRGSFQNAQRYAYNGLGNKLATYGKK